MGVFLYFYTDKYLSTLMFALGRMLSIRFLRPINKQQKE